MAQELDYADRRLARINLVIEDVKRALALPVDRPVRAALCLRLDESLKELGATNAVPSAAGHWNKMTQPAR